MIRLLGGSGDVVVLRYQEGSASTMNREQGFLDAVKKATGLKVLSENRYAGATVETARGTRYGFRRRDNGLWGLTLFTADLTAEAERAARDWDIVERAAKDYERGK